MGNQDGLTYFIFRFLRRPLIQLDDAYWGGERRGGKRGRGAAGKTPFVAAVALNEVGHPIAMRMTVVSGFKTKEIGAWAKRHLGPGSLVISDGLKCFRAVERATCNHLGFTRLSAPDSGFFFGDVRYTFDEVC